MNMHFYMKGCVVPAIYDFGMNTNGLLYPGRFANARGGNCVMILLDNDGHGPTAAQLATIANLCAINPNWETKFFFQVG